MKTVVFAQAARLEFLAQVAYYNSEKAGLGVQFTAAVEQATILAATFPDIGTPKSANTKAVLVRGFPFSVIYRQASQRLTVVAVAHHARKPGYWQSRPVA